MNATFPNNFQQPGTVSKYYKNKRQNIKHQNKRTIDAIFDFVTFKNDREGKKNENKIKSPRAPSLPPPT